MEITETIKFVEINKSGQCVKLVGFCKAKDFKKRCPGQ